MRSPGCPAEVGGGGAEKRILTSICVAASEGLMGTSRGWLKLTMVGVSCATGKATSVGASEACSLNSEAVSIGTGVSTAAAFCSSCGEPDGPSRASVSSEGFGTLAISETRRERECQKYIPAAQKYQLFRIA